MRQHVEAPAVQGDGSIEGMGSLEEARVRFGQLVGETKVFTEPSPYLVLDDVFPRDIYERFQAALPGFAELRPMERDNLHIFPLWDAKSDAVASGDGAVGLRWLVNTVFSQDLAERFLERFSSSLSSMYADLFGSRSAEYRDLVRVHDWTEAGSLDVRPVGNVLPAHTDWPNRLISVVFYLSPANETWREEWGTRLYRITPAEGLDPVALMAKKQAFPDALIDRSDYKLLEFRPNRIVAFMNTPWSVHGAQVDGHPAERRWAVTKGINLPYPVTERIFGLPAELRGEDPPSD